MRGRATPTPPGEDTDSDARANDISSPTVLSWTEAALARLSAFLQPIADLQSLDPAMSNPGPFPPSFFHRRIRFPSGGDRSLAVTQGMDVVRQALAQWHLGPRGIGGGACGPDDALLVAAELLANAQQHGGGICELCLDLDPARQRLHITVADAAPDRLPQPAEPHRPAQLGGHGLHIVSMLSVWGSTPHADGKAVWAEVAVRTPPLRPAQPVRAPYRRVRRDGDPRPGSGLWEWDTRPPDDCPEHR